MLLQLPNFRFVGCLKGSFCGVFDKGEEPRPRGGAPRVRGVRPPDHRGRAKTHQRGSDFDGGDAHRVFTAAQNCSVTAVVSSVTFQPFVSAFSLANFCSS